MFGVAPAGGRRGTAGVEADWKNIEPGSAGPAVDSADRRDVVVNCDDLAGSGGDFAELPGIGPHIEAPCRCEFGEGLSDEGLFDGALGGVVVRQGVGVVTPVAGLGGGGTEARQLLPQTTEQGLENKGGLVGRGFLRGTGAGIRVQPLLDWAEVDIWRYIEREKIPIPARTINANGITKRFFLNQGLVSGVSVTI